MFVVDFIAAFLVAFVLTVMFAGVLGRRGFRRWRDRFGFLLLVLLGSWAGGVWLVAFGPAISGTHWLPFLIAGIMVALLALALMQLPKFRGAVYTPGQDREPAARLAIGLYFSITLLLFIVAICVRYFAVHFR